tara:strand:+ start:89 stop:1078 length:990 start_codon:yes stop_codon:yes gene_type:complete
MNQEVLRKLKDLKEVGLLSEEAKDLGFVSTGVYALNKIISGDYGKGVPIGQITQFHGESSTAKTVFATHILKEAQEAGFYSVLIDSENAYNPTFAKHLGIHPDKLIYSAPDTLEDCFNTIENTILAIRAEDTETPIVVAYDSIAVSPSKVEFEAEGYEGNNMVGAVRAKATGACLRKINPLLRKHNVALIIINQIRNKVGVMYGNPDTMAAGGKSLDYYLGVNLKCLSNKTSDLLKDEHKSVIGIQGTVRNTKNKVAVPHKSCEFKLMYDKGLDKYYGLLKMLELDDLVTRSGAWYSVEGTDKKFQSKDFNELLLTDEAFASIRKLLGI